MNIYLIRHADAAALGEWSVTQDADRPLTKTGEEQAQKLGAAFQRKGITFDALVTSPLLRARRTVEEMVKAGGKGAPEPKVCEEVAPGGKRRGLARFLKELGAAHVAVVGHQPDLGQFAAWLIGGKKAQIDLAKAGVAYIVCDGSPGKGEGRLVWLVTRELLDT
jgi:phosphohistidine phosphatase